MGYEVERKAWVHDWEAMERHLRATCRFDREYRKEDQYFLLPPTSRASGQGYRSTLRIRSDGRHAYVTFKEKEFRDGGEVNLEREFSVDDAPTFAELLGILGCRPEFTKVKEGLAFSSHGLTVELSRLEGLGSFLEVEQVLETDAPVAVAQADAAIRDFMRGAGVADEDVEPEPYMKLLRQARGE